MAPAVQNHGLMIVGVIFAFVVFTVEFLSG